MKEKNKNLNYKNYTFAYFPGESYFHKLNPLSKIFFVILLTILTFSTRSLVLLTIILLSIFLLALISEISLKRLLRKIRFISIVLIFSVFLNIFFNAIPSEQETILFYLFNLEFLPIRRLAVYFALRALLIVLTLYSSTIIYTNTTSAKDFVYSLIKLKISYRYCFSFMVGVRYIPLIEQEAKTIALAQRARGLGLRKTKSVKRAYQLIFERLLATLVSILRKGHTTSISMENRCFGIYKKRTNLVEIKFKLKDVLFMIITFSIFLILLLYISKLLPIPQISSLYSIYNSIF